MSDHQTRKGLQLNSAKKACLFLRQVRSTLHMIFLQLTLNRRPGWPICRTNHQRHLLVDSPSQTPID